MGDNASDLVMEAADAADDKGMVHRCRKYTPGHVLAKGARDNTGLLNLLTTNKE